MPTVTVDAADLETLLFFTSAIGDIEAAIQQRSRNPMVLTATPRLAQAHDRLATAWRRSSRPEPEQSTEADLALLRTIVPEVERDDEVQDIEVGYTNDLNALLRLGQTLQLVEYGPTLKGTQIQWPAPAEAGFVPDTVRGPGSGVVYGARLTARGKKALGR